MSGAVLVSSSAFAEEATLAVTKVSAQNAVAAAVQPAAEVDRATTHTGDFDRIRTPDSPAFVILGVSPTEIQRPGTPKALATALSGFFSEGSVVIPRNLALEVSPYWIVGHPDLTAKEYAQGGALNALRSFTISLATKQSTRQTADAAGATTDHTDSDIGIGVRSRVFWYGLGKGSNCTDSEQLVIQTAANLAAAAVVPEQQVLALEAKHGRGTPEFLAEFQKEQDARKEVLAPLQAQLENARITLAEKCPELAYTARGFSIDVAGAWGWSFPDSIATSANGDLRAAAGWLTAAYARESLTAAFLSRYNGTQAGLDWQKDLDLGLRFVYKRAEFALSGEGIGRVHVGGPGPDGTFKVDIAAEYKVAGDTWITLTIGRNFDRGAGSALFGVANVNVGFGEGPDSKRKAN